MAAGIFLCLGFLLPAAKLPKTNAIQQEPDVLTEILSTEKEEMSAGAAAIATEETPFDEDTKAPMPGSSVTFKTDKIGQITSENGNTIDVNRFSINSETSIFMWIYFPDDPYEVFFSLEISFSTATGQSIVWSFNSNKLYELVDSSIKDQLHFGWKQVELVYDDAEKPANAPELKLIYMSVNYTQEAEYPGSSPTSGSMSFYNIYTAQRSINQAESTVARSSAYFHYSISPDFNAKLNGVELGGTFYLSSIQSVFSYAYVGKTALHKVGTQNNRFIWTITLTAPNNNTEEVGIRQTIKFDSIGEYKLSFKLEEQRNLQKKLEIFTFQKTIRVNKYRFGIFSSRSYEVEKDKAKIITFEVSGDFDASPDNYVFSIKNEKIAKIKSIKFDSDKRLFYIEVEGLKKGTTEVVATVTGSKEGGEVQEFSQSSTVSVTFEGISSWVFTILYIILGVSGVALVIFVSISFVNARKNSVK